MHITSKFGAVINGKKVGREEFFNTLQEWGADDNIRFVIFHYSILSEGIRPGLTHSRFCELALLLNMAQTIGRVIGVHKDDRKAVADGLIPQLVLSTPYKKGYGQVTMPTDTNKAMLSLRLQNVINQIFIEGVPPSLIAK